jgi:ribonucleotide reductase alpha subunit
MMRITLCALFLSYSSLSRPISTFRKSPLFFSNTSADNLALENIIERIDQSATGINREYVDIEAVASKVHKGMFKGITWREFDNLASETSAYMSTDHPDYTKLASRIAIQSLHRNAPQTFSEAIELLYNYIDPKTGLNSSFISKELYNFVKRHSDEIDRYIQHERDFDIDFFGFKTLEKSYLFRIEDNIIETPQYMFMRVALGIHMKDNDLRSAFETYDMMSDKWFIHASPTLFNSGTPRPQLSSCFLLGIQSDSIEGIYATLQKCAQISKSAGGIGLYVQNVRSKGSSIGSSKGISNGIVPMLRVFDATARYIDQGGRRPGAIAVSTISE